jgi:dynein heavy chain
VRCLRPDRIIFATTAFIINNLGQKYTEPPVLDLNSVLADSQPDLPLILVLSPGVDPTNQLSQLGEAKGIPFSSIALGQGQARAADCLPHHVPLSATDGCMQSAAECHSDGHSVPCGSLTARPGARR